MMFSFDVKVDGKAVPRQLDIMMHNKSQISGTPPFPCMQPGGAGPLITKDEPTKGEIVKIKWEKK
jgi:hypothetical protein